MSNSQGRFYSGQNAILQSQSFNMFSLGKTPNNVSTPRFINMENGNSIYRKILRQSFGNAVYKNNFE